jgi:hypothetical protein
MGHRISWDNEDKTVVLQEYTDDPSKDDFYHMVEKSSRMLYTVSHTVHLIIDQQRFNLTFSAADMNHIQMWMPKNQGVLVLIAQPDTLAYKAAIHNLSQQLALRAGEKAYFADTIPEAREILRERLGVRYPTSPSY